MKKMLATLSLFFVLSLLFTSITDANTEWKTKNLGTKPNDYTVTVTLSQSVDAQSLNSAAIYAENEWQQRVDIQTTVKDNKLFIAPKTKYPNGATISIYINSNLLSTSKQALQKPTKIILHIDDLQDDFEPRQDALNDVVFAVERIILANKDLLNLSQGNCEFKSIELNAKSNTLVAGQAEKWEAVGHFAFTNDRIIIPTPSSVVSFSSDNRYVTVSNKGELRVSEDVPTKQQATITLTVKNPVTNEQQRVKKVIQLRQLQISRKVAAINRQQHIHFIQLSILRITVSLT